ncbi:MAG: membrane protein required for colicin V production [Saprospiraceae bacterium]|jgi:membrane protein required for colicin V production
MSFAWLDVVVIAFVAISVLVGIFRGLVKEVLSLTSWVLAAFIAYQNGEIAASYLELYIKESMLALAIAYVAVFLIALIGLSVVSYLISRLFNATGMSAIDRSLGSMFGAVRAAAIMGILILIGHFLNLNDQSWWTDSQLLDYFIPVADWITSYLPESIVDKIQHTSTPSAAEAAAVIESTISTDAAATMTTQ